MKWKPKLQVLLNISMQASMIQRISANNMTLPKYENLDSLLSMINIMIKQSSTNSQGKDVGQGKS